MGQTQRKWGSRAWVRAVVNSTASGCWVSRYQALARTDLVAGNEVMLFHQARQLGFPSDTFVTVATLAEQDNCFAFNPAADKQQVVRLQQALDKVRQGEAFKRLIARYQDVVQSPPADHLPTIE